MTAMGQSYVHSFLMCYKLDIYYFTGNSVIYAENMKH